LNMAVMVLGRSLSRTLKNSFAHVSLAGADQNGRDRFCPTVRSGSRAVPARSEDGNDGSLKRCVYAEQFV
jgi:hypothetical protein